MSAVCFLGVAPAVGTVAEDGCNDRVLVVGNTALGSGVAVASPNPGEMNVYPATIVDGTVSLLVPVPNESACQPISRR